MVLGVFAFRIANREGAEIQSFVRVQLARALDAGRAFGGVGFAVVSLAPGLAGVRAGAVICDEGVAGEAGWDVAGGPTARVGESE